MYGYASQYCHLDLQHQRVLIASTRQMGAFLRRLGFPPLTNVRAQRLGREHGYTYHILDREETDDG